MQLLIYDKTNKGREEIRTRQYQLPTRLRSLLVLIDGKTSDLDLVKKIAALGLTIRSLQELADQGFIQAVTVYPEDAQGADPSLEDGQTIFEPFSPEETWNTAPQHIELEQEIHTDIKKRETRLALMKIFLIGSIKQTLGLKGFFLQRKVNRAHSLIDIHKMRRDYVAAILQVCGKERALQFRDQFDQRMYVRFSLDDPEFLED
ncbi:MAG: hypothetical protein K2P84_05330 [Undibacterium sp.]|nr:hypothetical protein [Undibacterium sp.]